MAEQLRDVVVVLPGIMGSVLRDAHGDDVWKLSAGSILKGVLGSRQGDQAPASFRTASATTIPATASPRPRSCPTCTSCPASGRSRSATSACSRGSASRSTSSRPIRSDPERVVELRAVPVRLAPVEPVQRACAAADGRAGARTLPKPTGKRRRPARVHQSLDGWARHELLRRRAGRPRGDRQGHHTRHAAPRCAERARLARERRAQGDRSDRLRPHRPRPQPARAVPAAARVRVHRRGRRAAEDDGDRRCRNSNAAMVADAMRFHEELRAGAAAHAARTRRTRSSPARSRPTRRRGSRAAPSRRCARSGPTTASEDQKGDGTVPRLSAAPYGVASNSPTLRYVMDKHGALPKNEPALVELGGVLTGTSSIPRGGVPIPIGVVADDVLVAGETLARDDRERTRPSPRRDRRRGGHRHRIAAARSSSRATATSPPSFADLRARVLRAAGRSRRPSRPRRPSSLRSWCWNRRARPSLTAVPEVHHGEPRAVCGDQRLPDPRHGPEGLRQRREGVGGRAHRPLRLRVAVTSRLLLDGDATKRKIVARLKSSAAESAARRRARVHQLLARHLSRRRKTVTSRASTKRCVPGTATTGSSSTTSSGSCSTISPPVCAARSSRTRALSGSVTRALPPEFGPDTGQAARALPQPASPRSARAARRSADCARAQQHAVTRRGPNR